MEIEIQGDSNPVLCAMKSLKYLNLKINEQSFLNVAYIVGDIECNTGFIIESVDDVKKLCDIGNFQIVIEDGIYTAKLNNNI